MRLTSWRRNSDLLRWPARWTMPKTTDPTREINQMVRCVQLFFGRRMNQRDIAAALDIDQSKVSRLLKRAFEEGFYRVEFNFPTFVDLEAQLQDRYALRGAVVVPAAEPDSLKHELGRAAARYFETLLYDGLKIGLSCGNTLLYFVQHLKSQSLPVQIYPLAAETSLKFADISFNTLVGMMTAKYRPAATGYALPAQLLPRKSTKEISKAFVGEPEVRRIFDESHDVDIAIVGIGALDPTSPGFCELAVRTAVPVKKLRKMGVVGEFNYQPFDDKGVELKAPELVNLMNPFIGVSISRLRELRDMKGRLVIAIAGGPDKRDAIQAALLGRLFNVLVTDHETAGMLLSNQ